MFNKNELKIYVPHMPQGETRSSANHGSLDLQWQGQPQRLVSDE
jgi:hypothetical protein